MISCVSCNSFNKYLPISNKYNSLLQNKLVRKNIKLTVCAEGQIQGQNKLRTTVTQFVDDFVKDGQILGLGSGDMATMTIQCIGERMKEGKLKGIIGIATSDASSTEATFQGIPMKPSADVEKIDLLFTDVDEIDTTDGGDFPFIFARISEPQQPQIPRMRAVVDKSTCVVAFVDDPIKCVQRLGRALPVVINDEGWEDTAEELDDEFLGDAEVWRRPFSGTSNPRGGDNPYISSEGHNILDIKFYEGYKLLGEPAEYQDLVKTIMCIQGVVITGLMLRGADFVFVAGEKDTKILSKEEN